jgi:hypothetical protein
MRKKSLIPVVYIQFLAILLLPIFLQAEAITWSVNEYQLTTYDFYDGYPAVMQTKDGRVWLVWSKEIQTNLTLYRRISSDQGRTWSEEQNLTDKQMPGHDQNPSIMQAQNGTIWVVWTSTRPSAPSPPMPDFYMEASPQNLTVPKETSENSTIMVTSIDDFSETVALSVLNEPVGVNTSLVPTQVLLPSNDTANSTLTISVNSTATPGNYTLIVMGSGDHMMHSVNIYLEIPVAAASSQTATYVHSNSLSTTAGPSSADFYEIFYKTSHDNGETWSTAVQLTDNSVDDLRPAIVQLANGTIMIVFQSYVSDNHDILYMTTNDGTSWSNPAQLTTDVAHDKGPAVTRMKDGKIWVAWTSIRTSDYEIYYKIFDGVTWSSDTRLTSNTNFDVQPALVQAIDETVLIFWASAPSNGDYDIYYKASSTGGLTWSDRIPFAASGYEDLWPAVARSKDTKIWVVWASNAIGDNWEIFAKTSLAGDVNEDNKVNVMDLTIVSMAYGTFQGEPEYLVGADINRDGIVDMRDLRIVAYYLGAT